jgi:glucose-1-phosphate thymidylyltransferase
MHRSIKEADDAQRFGVAEVRDNRILNIAEKPNPAKSNYVVPGIYLYNSTVFQKIKCLNSSGREELEITDVHSFYSEEDKLTYEMLHGWWTDAGTFKSLPRANNLVA